MASVEVITACENVCGDFGWLVPDDPRIIQGFLTVVAAIIASCTAIYIAQVVYPKQKEKDHALDWRAEKRALFRQFLSQVDLAVHIPKGQKWFWDERFTKLQMLQSEIRLICENSKMEDLSADVLSAFFDLKGEDANGVVVVENGWRGAFENLMDKKTALVDEMKNELRQ